MAHLFGDSLSFDRDALKQDSKISFLKNKNTKTRNRSYSMGHLSKSKIIFKEGY